MKKYITVLLVFILAVSLLLSENTFAAKSIKELQQEQEQLRAKERDTKELLEGLRKESRTLREEVSALSAEIELSETQLAYIHSRLDFTRHELDVAMADLEEAEKERENHYEAFKKRMRYIQEYGKIGYVQVLFKAKSIGDFLNRMEYVNDIVTYDQNMHIRLEDIEQLIAQKKADIEEQLTNIEVLLMEEEEKMLSLEQSKQAKQSLLEEIENDEEKYGQQLKEYQEESESLAKKIREEQAKAERAARAAASAGRLAASTGSGTAPSGQFAWPVPGNYRLSSGYVNRISPISGRPEFHTGIDIPASRGTNIVAAENGTVILAGSNGGYGICVVIDHGNGVSTLYGHNSALTVSVGDYVTRGQTIAKCGSTGMSTGNHCHFEVRINGSPTNPGPYVGL